MVDKNDSLLREVEEELRHDQLKKLWTEYGTYFIAAAALFVACVFIYQQMESRRIAAAEAAGARFETARHLLQDKKPAEAEAVFADIAKSGPAGYAALARLQTAGALVKDEKTTEAVASYDAIAGDNAADRVLRDFSRMQAASLKLGTADWTEMENRLTPLVDERNAFHAPARELLGLAAQKAGRVEDARKLFLQVIGDSKASQSLKERVSGYLSGIITADMTKAQTPGIQGAPAAAPQATPAAPSAASPASVPVPEPDKK